jgi:hypothetical protein
MLHVVYRGSEQPGFLVHACTLGGASDVLKVAPGNKPPAEGPYACVIPVLDAWRVVKALAEKNGVRHFSDAVEPEVLADVRAGRALLVFDLTNEGPALNRDLCASLHRWADDNAVPASRMVWVDQNRSNARLYREMFQGQRDGLMGFECYDFFVKITAWFFSPRSREPVLGPDPEAYVARAFDPARKSHLLLCLNATPRPHRILTIAALMRHGLLDASLVSFPGLAYAKDGGVGDGPRMERYIDDNPDFEYLRADCQAVLQLGELKVDSFSEKGNALFNKIETAPYEHSFFSLVTETEMTGGEVDRITEKIVKPFCLGHPTLTVGNPNATRFMTEIGFQDFGDLIDRGYEAEAQPGMRFKLLFEQVQRQAAAIRANPAQWLGQVREIGSANIRYAASGRLLDSYAATFDRRLGDNLARRLHAQANG